MTELPSALPSGLRRVLVTGGAGFIGGAVVRRLMRDTDVQVFNLGNTAIAPASRHCCVVMRYQRLKAGS